MPYDRPILYNRHLYPKDVKKLLVTKFNMLHDVKLVRLPCKPTLHLQIMYSKPFDPNAYESEIIRIANTINNAKSSEFFINKILYTKEYPDFIVCSGEVIDIPLSIDLQIDDFQIDDLQID